jgi:signal transduction histidine kinase
VRFRPSIRLRLTLVYGGLFVAAGAVLLAVNYALVSRGLHDRVRQIEFPLEGVVVEGPGTVVPMPGTDAEFIDASDIRAYEEDVRDQALHQLLVQSSIGLAAMALVSVGVGWVVAGRMLRPLQQVTGAARHLSETSLHQRLALEGPQDELKELADTFDGMLARLEAAFESQRRFVANASHELRTPLAIQRTLVDVALADPDATPEDLRRMASAVRDAVDRSERLIDGLLVLARSEDGRVPAEAVDLDVAARHAMEQAGDEAAAAGLDMTSHLDPAPTTGSRVLLERLVANLVQNSVRHNVADGWVAVETGTDDGRSWVTVRNSGPVIAPDEVSRMFEPFRRLNADRVHSTRGVGLGLSIVRAVANAHGGAVTAEPVASGGLEVTVTLAARADGHPRSDRPPAVTAADRDGPRAGG